MNGAATLYVTWGRIFAMLLAAEVAWHYAGWWWKLRPADGDPALDYPLRLLIVGAAIGALGILVLVSYALTALPVSGAGRFVVPLGYTLIVASLLYELALCWLIDRGRDSLAIARGSLWRAVLSLLAALCLVALR
jgi:hypothetical protein